MARTKKHAVSPSEAGCWFDGNRGIYLQQAVLEAAKEHGWRGKAYVRKKADEMRYKGDTHRLLGPDDEEYYDAADEAEAYLNTLAPEGYYFGYSEGGGDFGLWKCEGDGDDGEEGGDDEEDAV